jgi:uncharacterized membrane protein YesL
MGLFLLFGISQYDKENTFFVIYFIIAVALNVLFTMMMFYVYPMIVTFKLSLKQIFKNAFLFVHLGVKTNILTLFFCVLLIVPFIIGFIYFPAIIVILPLILLSTIGLIINFNVYPYLKKYIIDPYYKDHPEELEELKETAIFNDREAEEDEE